MSEISKPKAAQSWTRDENNWYVEPEWCSRRLFDVVDFTGRIVDPCAGRGNIIRSAKDAGLVAEGHDLIDRRVSSPDGAEGGRNFLTGAGYMPGAWPVPNIVSNPPYGPNPDPSTKLRLEEYFIELALRRAVNKVAVFLPSAWLNGDKRSQWLEGLPLYRVYFLAPRPSCPPGAALVPGVEPSGGTKDYAWFVFLRGFDGPWTGHWMRRDV